MVFAAFQRVGRRKSKNVLIFIFFWNNYHLTLVIELYHIAVDCSQQQEAQVGDSSRVFHWVTEGCWRFPNFIERNRISSRNFKENQSSVKYA